VSNEESQMHLKSKQLEELAINYKQKNNTSSNYGIHAPKSVLLIDDDICILKSLTRVFNKSGISVSTAMDGLIGCKMIVSEQPLLLTLDLNMQLIDGIEVIKFIKSLNLENKIWIIVISADSEEELVNAVNYGADFYLKKPFVQKDIEKIITKVFDKVQTKDLYERGSFRSAS